MQPTAQTVVVERKVVERKAEQAPQGRKEGRPKELLRYTSPKKLTRNYSCRPLTCNIAIGVLRLTSAPLSDPGQSIFGQSRIVTAGQSSPLPAGRSNCRSVCTP